MSLNLPPPPVKYDRNEAAQMRRALMDEDRKNFKRGGDLEIANGRVVIRSPDGNRWYLTVSNAGVVGATAL